VLFYRLNGGINGLDLYRWSSSCAAPTLAGQFDFGGLAPHEFYLWQDPARPARVLLFVSMFASSDQELQVIDISTIGSPIRVGGWTPPATYSHAPLHSIDISADGRTAYISLWTGGLVIADSSDFATGVAAPLLRPLTPPGSAYTTPPGNVHSAVPLPGRAQVLTTDERYPSPFGAGCPSGTAHVVDVSNSARPVAVSTLAVPENQASACSASARDTWTSHNPTLTAHLALITWYSAGLQVFALDDPVQPSRLAEYRAAGISPAQRDLQLGTSDTLAWSYPVLFKGLIYLADINQGLQVLRYSGPHQDEVSQVEFSEGNSNISRAGAVPVTASAATTPTSAATPVPSPSITAGPAPGAAGNWLLLTIFGGVLLMALTTLSILGVRRRR
jgi:hypothetical protein